MRRANLIQAGVGYAADLSRATTGFANTFRQFGNTPYSSDYPKVTYADANGVAAFKWYTDRITKDKVGYPNFANTMMSPAFKSGKAAMNIDGSFRIATLKAEKRP